MVAGEPALRVLQVASSLYDWGGIERYVVHLSDGLAARGHEVVVACPKSSPLDKRVNVQRVSISVKHKISIPTVLEYLKLFKQGKFDVVHAHFSPDFLAPAIAAKLSRQPFTIMTRHVAVTWRSAKVQQYTRLFDHFIPVSGAVLEKLQLSGIPLDRMTVAKAGCPALVCDKDREALRAELGLAGFTTGVFGRLVKDKGIDLAIKAACQSDTRVAIFGDGPERAALERPRRRLRRPSQALRLPRRRSGLHGGCRRRSHPQPLDRALPILRSRGDVSRKTDHRSKRRRPTRDDRKRPDRFIV